MQFKRDKTELHQMQVMPLRYKIRMTADRIESWYAHYAHYRPGVPGGEAVCH